jgi:hypothetical protein
MAKNDANLDEDDGVDDMEGVCSHLDVEPEVLEAFQKDLKSFLSANLKELDNLFAKHPGMLEAVAEYGLTVQMIPFEVEFEPEGDSGLH